jgi:hypothetical protein
MDTVLDVEVVSQPGATAILKPSFGSPRIVDRDHWAEWRR